MSDIGRISQPGASAFGHNNGRIPPGYQNSAAPAAQARRNDQVEFSDTARLLSKLNEMPEIRQELVDRVKQEIADGSYETPEKIEVAVDAMLEDLG
ncbi:flagellar biosynthesis anti-sigma factor FlgM [Phycisphaerales bacterium AB-hyl4]|uniref:Negative regulator of flagellin synthesis n=1 Tax=Natronomicrosphaera hydrolytica TaxID=3242702 RepID=A0ABV4TZT7_9BACT